MTALLFSDKNVDSNLITWNRVVLLHGNGAGLCDVSVVDSFVRLRGVTALLWWEPQLSSSVPCPRSQCSPCLRVSYLTLHLAAIRLLPCDFSSITKLFGEFSHCLN